MGKRAEHNWLSSLIIILIKYHELFYRYANVMDTLILYYMEQEKIECDTFQNQ